MNKPDLRPLGGGTETNRRSVKVTVTILNDNPSEFDMVSDDIEIKKINTGHSEDFLLTFNNVCDGECCDGFNVIFDVIDSTSKGYGFFVGRKESKPDPHLAMSAKIVDASGHCPPEGARWPGFTPINASRTTLTVENPNDRLQYFGFALHFSLEDETASSLTFDPIGDDRNGHYFSR